MDYKIKYDNQFRPNSSDVKLFMGSLKQYSNAVDKIVIEFENLPDNFVPFLNVERYLTSYEPLDSTPPLVAFQKENETFTKIITGWFTERVGFIVLSATLLGETIEVDGYPTTPRIETGKFFFAIDKSLTSSGDGGVGEIVPPEPININDKVSKNLSMYDISELGNNAWVYVDTNGIPTRVRIDDGGVLTDKELMSKGAILKELENYTPSGVELTVNTIQTVNGNIDTIVLEKPDNPQNRQVYIESEGEIEKFYFANNENETEFIEEDYSVPITDEVVFTIENYSIPEEIQNNIIENEFKDENYSKPLILETHFSY